MKMTESEIQEYKQKRAEEERLLTAKKLKICLCLCVASVIFLIVSCIIGGQIPLLIAAACTALTMGTSITLASRVYGKQNRNK